MSASIEQSKGASETPEVEASDTSSSEVQDTNGGNGSMSELRRLLLGPEEVSEVLPDAVTRSSQKNSQLSDATLPIVEQNIRESVVRNPTILADALFPVIGPAIRKAISAALSAMVQSVNQTVELSLSPKSIGWRLEAMRTGKSFGEIVMLKTLLYSVEQVFLIHKKTGILLQHVARNPRDMQDADMVSAMLTAISDFAHDAFKTADDATLDSFNISGLNVWIEDSPDALIAGVIRGNPPLEIRETFELAIEKVQFSFERELKSFEGETSIFEPARPVLEECLLFRAGEVTKKEKSFFSPTNILAGASGLLLVLVLGYFAFDYWRWSGLLESVRSEPGLVLTDYERGWFQHSIEGLKDPLTDDPKLLLTKNGYDESDVLLVWREFHSDDPVFVVARATKLLRPPEGVELKFANGILTAEGAVSKDWSDEAERLSGFVTGVTGFKLKDDGGALRSAIEASNIAFACGSVDVKSKENLDKIAGDISQLASIREFELGIEGHADPTGTAEVNKTISLRRAEEVASVVQTKIASDSRAERVRIKKTVAEGGNECKVTFKVSP